MEKFRKKPVIIRATKWDGKVETFYDLRNWYAENVPNPPTKIIGLEAGDLAGSLRLGTLEGELLASVDDMIICGVNGELYPCKPDIFAATYDPVDLHAEDVPPVQLSEDGARAMRELAECRPPSID